MVSTDNWIYEYVQYVQYMQLIPQNAVLFNLFNNYFVLSHFGAKLNRFGQKWDFKEKGYLPWERRNFFSLRPTPSLFSFLFFMIFFFFHLIFSFILSFFCSFFFSFFLFPSILPSFLSFFISFFFLSSISFLSFFLSFFFLPSFLRDVSIIYTFLQKVTQHDFNQVYFFYLLFIKLDMSWKACLFAFRLMPNLLGLFYWGACRVRKLGATSNMKGCRIDRIEWEMHVPLVFGFPFVSVCTSTHDPFIAPQSSQNFGGFGAMNGSWVLVHTLTRGKPKTCVFPIQSDQF